MDSFNLISYELKGIEGKIIVKNGATEEEIKEFCVLDRIEKINKEELAQQVNLIKGVNKDE